MSLALNPIRRVQPAPPLPRRFPRPMTGLRLARPSFRRSFEPTAATWRRAPSRTKVGQASCLSQKALFVPPPAAANSSRLIETGRMPVLLSPPRQSTLAPFRKPDSFRRVCVDCQTRAEAMRRQAVGRGRSGRRESNPQCEFGRLACCQLHHSRAKGKAVRESNPHLSRSKRPAFVSVKLTARVCVKVNGGT